ncbi:MAG: cobalamin-dependent protein, partial [Dehalococcoidia bacterium]|nr:cobalamin-dependent protein [Dehalococcoidia bacterium]
IVGERFEKGEYFLGELIMSGEIFKQAMSFIEPKLTGDVRSETIGQVIMGTVKGDIHSIGKDIVTGLLRMSGFEVLDLGVDVAPEAFVEKLLESGAPILGMSALITPSFESMKNTVTAIEKRDIRDRVKVIIGGGIVIEQVKRYVGADAFTRDGAEGVKICKEFIRKANK